MAYSNFYETTSVYKVQCKTASIANDLAGIHANVSTMSGIYKPPFCLRILKPYRNEEMQQFRNKVAKKTWEIREKGRGGRNDRL